MSEPERGDLLGQLWGAHVKAEFPDRLRRREVEGVDLVLLDTYAAGCVSSSLAGVLDETRHRILLECIAALEKVLPSIADEDGAGYYERLHEMAVLAAGPGDGGSRLERPSP